MNLPTREECMQMLKEHNNPEHIIRHSLLVNRVAYFLAEKIKENNNAINLELVDRASLLHDVAKYRTLESDIRHGQAGHDILRERGFPEIAVIVKEHALSEILKKDSLKSLESKIVFYADKRVRQDTLVSLEVRFDYLRKKYGSKSKEIMGTINSCYAPCQKLEEELFGLAGTDKELKGLDVQ